MRSGNVKSTVKISSIFVTFLENMNFKKPGKIQNYFLQPHCITIVLGISFLLREKRAKLEKKLGRPKKEKRLGIVSSYVTWMSNNFGARGCRISNVEAGRLQPQPASARPRLPRTTATHACRTVGQLCQKCQETSNLI